MLHIYTATHCLSAEKTREIIAFLQDKRPAFPFEVINMDEKGVQVPAYVIGTPTYVLNNQVIFLGNPAREILLQRLDRNFHDASNGKAQ